MESIVIFEHLGLVIISVLFLGI